MSLDAATLLAIFGMAAFTYLTRIGGPLLLSRVRLSRRGEAALQAVPPAVLMAVIAPTALATGPAETGAAAVTALAALRLPLLACIAIGVGTLLAIRALIG
ncbi:AzlD domain-containing protein [Stappia sp. F7233]|uniref:AzlD domain-containing protein n=1 Tax=Stappia albiluteola TaxID=2758565 RepID=A0A839AFH9_9HYPH|nr:AzlD domain-containing protein [Stappia albiluteola]MBA5777788.1 AzlD domain-containing protein [Stappia albiluteola]